MSPILYNSMTIKIRLSITQLLTYLFKNIRRYSSSLYVLAVSHLCDSTAATFLTRRLTASQASVSRTH